MILEIAKENEKDIIEILNRITKAKIEKIEFYNSIGMNDLSDYNFNMSELTGITSDNRKAKIYMKKIKRNKIKESIFCYWTVLYEEYMRYRQYEEMKKIINKVSIGEIEKEEEFKKSVFLSIENNNSEFLKNGTTVHLVDIKEYINNFFSSYKSTNFWKKIEDMSNEDILLIGIVLM